MFRQYPQLLFSLVVLSILSVSISWWKRLEKEGIDPELFRLPTDVQINEIRLRKGDTTVVLTGGPGGWRVNDRHAADLNRVRLLFAAMDRARPRRLAGDSIAGHVRQEAVGVQFSENENTIRSVLIWGDRHSGSTWFMDPEEGIPTEMFIPGYRASLTNLFSLVEEEWRDKRIFDFNWRNFVKLKTEFLPGSEDGFTIFVRDGLLSIAEVATPDTTRLKGYMDAVQLLEAESIIRLSQIQKDSLLRETPASILTLSEVSGQIHELRFFPTGLALRDSIELFRIGPDGARLLRSSRKVFQPR